MLPMIQPPGAPTPKSGLAEALVDAAGVAHPPAPAAARIVSLVPSITELLFDLGLGPQLVGRTHYCVHPAAGLARVPSLGGTKKIRMERLLALRPTHAIVNIDENTRAMAEEIAAAGIAVIVTHPLDPLDNPPLYRLIGGIFGRGAEAEALAARFAAAFDAVRDGAGAAGWPERRVLYLIWQDPWMTVSRDTYVSRMLALVGWRTVAHDPATRYPAVTIDAALLREVDIVLFSSEPFPFTEQHLDAFRTAHSWPSPGGGPALALVDGEMLSWYGSRAIAGLTYLRDKAAGLGRDLDGGPAGLAAGPGHRFSI